MNGKQWTYAACRDFNHSLLHSCGWMKKVNWFRHTSLFVHAFINWSKLNELHWTVRCASLSWFHSTHFVHYIASIHASLRSVPLTSYRSLRSLHSLISLNSPHHFIKFHSFQFTFHEFHLITFREDKIKNIL